MASPQLQFHLGEAADAIGESTARFAADRIAAAGRKDRRGEPLPTRALGADGRARPARDHRRGAVRRGGANEIRRFLVGRELIGA